MLRNATIAMSLLLVSLSAHAYAEEELHPVAADVAEQLDDPTKPFVMIVEFEVKAGMADAFVQAAAEPRLQTVKEEGNLAYALSRAASEKQEEAGAEGENEGEEEAAEDDNDIEFYLYEHWKSVAALDAHLKQPYLVEFLAKMGDLLEEEPEIDVCIPVPMPK